MWKCSTEHGSPRKLYRQSIWAVGEVLLDEKLPQGCLALVTEQLQYRVLWTVKM